MTKLGLENLFTVNNFANISPYDARPPPKKKILLGTESASNQTVGIP